MNQRKRPMAFLLLALAFGLTGCPAGPELDLCETSHQIRLALDHEEAALRYIAEKATAVDAAEIYARSELDAVAAASDAFLADLASPNPCAAVWVYDEYSKHACEDDYSDADTDRDFWKLKKARNGFYLDSVFLYAESEARDVAKMRSKGGLECRPGEVAKKQSDGSVAMVDDPCASKVPGHLEGYDEAVALADDLGELSRFVHENHGRYQTNPGKVQAALARIERIKSNGVVAYLAISCAANEAFTKLDRRVPRTDRGDKHLDERVAELPTPRSAKASGVAL